jgi:hypothetical protein
MIELFNTIYMQDMLTEKDPRNEIGKKQRITNSVVWKTIAALTDLTVAKPWMSVANITPKETVDTITYLTEAMRATYIDAVGNSVMSSEDAELLAYDQQLRFGAARELADKLITIQGETGESPFTKPEELTLALLSLWPSVVESTQVGIWEKYAPHIDRPMLAEHPDDRVSVFAQGLAGGSASAEKMITLIEHAIARYDAQRKQREALRSGSEAPVVSPGDWRREQDAAQSEAEAELKADQED